MAQYLNWSSGKKNIFYAVFCCLIIYQFVLATHVIFGRLYDNEIIWKDRVYAELIKQKNIPDEAVIAIAENVPYDLNFLTDKSIVVFRPDTVKKLIAQDKIVKAFADFNVKYILGYSPELTEEILSKTKIENISDNNISKPQFSGYNNQMWFMNLVK